MSNNENDVSQTSVENMITRIKNLENDLTISNHQFNLQYDAYQKLEQENNDILQLMKDTQRKHKETVDNMQMRIKELENFVDDDSLGHKDELIARQNAELSALRNKIDGLETEIFSKDDELGRYKNSAETLVLNKDKKIQELERKIVAQTEEMTAKFNELQRRLRETSQHLITTKSENVDLQANLTGLKILVKQLEEANEATKSAELLSLQQKNQNLTERLDSITSSRLKATEEHRLIVEKLEKDLEDTNNKWKTRYGKLKGENTIEIQQLKEKIEKLNEQITYFESSEQQYNQGNVELKSSLKIANEKLSQSNEKIFSLQNSCEKQQDIIKGLQNEVNTLSFELKNSKEKETEFQEIAALHKEIAERDNFIKDKEYQTNEALKHLQNSLERFTDIIQNKDQEIRNLKEIVKKECTERQELISEISYLKQQLDNSSSEPNKKIANVQTINKNRINSNKSSRNNSRSSRSRYN
eukprot:TRINITY_DN11759_c0_g1_i1.p1 TRINITY_DN11759_c0_g1~~TRINITY_DN11759_c0_g1_i1.p1  ORF type:complete len:472 (+),score=137.11 TRINITY_DN11759_c0_g1_i1:230-1645(+)